MKKSGHVAVIRFPQADMRIGKPRPVLLVTRVPGPYDDWLVCMISTQLDQAIPDFDEIIGENEGDFHQAGVKATSVVRIARLAVVSGEMLVGAIGEISPDRLERIRRNLSLWISGART